MVPAFKRFNLMQAKQICSCKVWAKLLT